MRRLKANRLFRIVLLVSKAEFFGIVDWDNLMCAVMFTCAVLAKIVLLSTACYKQISLCEF